MKFELTRTALPSWLSHDERSTARLVSNSHADVRIGHGETQVARVLDISPFGCRLKKPAEAIVGKAASLLIAGRVQADGWVVWSDGDACGIDFARALTSAELEIVAKPHRSS